MDVKLVVVGGKQAGIEIPMPGPEFLIGRGTECRLQPRSSLVSRRHCAIVIEGAAVVLKDFGSTNGTLVNGERVQERRELRSGDRIKVGLLELEIRIAAAASKKPQSDAGKAATIDKAAPASADEEIDISDWLQADAPKQRTAGPDEKTTVHDTAVGRPVDETTTSMPTTVQQPKPHTPPKKEAKPAKVAGQFQRKAAPMADSSKAAAEDTLRKLFHRGP